MLYYINANHREQESFKLFSMNSKITFKFLLVVISLLLSFNLQAQKVPPITVNVATAGTLPNLIASTKKYQITNLTVTGYLNGTDLLFIREMAGSNVNGNITLGKLSVLDLSRANIVAGGDYYFISNSESFSSKSNLIGNYAFYGCTSLTSMTIPSRVTSIGGDAFGNCTGLTSITIPSSVTSIGDGTFMNCTGLTSITIPSSVTSIGDDAFYGCTGLTSITIPSSVTSIGDGAFMNCTGLTSMTILRSVTSIGDDAFNGCTSLTSITIPSSVTSIGNYAFNGCTRITEIHSRRLTPPIITNSTFTGMNQASCKLYVPKGAYSTYWLAVGWSDFTNIIEEESTSTAISQTETSNVKVYTDQNAIIVVGANLGDNVSIHNELGVLLQSTKVIDDIVRINVPANHIYLVKTIDKTFKIAL